MNSPFSYASRKSAASTSTSTLIVLVTLLLVCAAGSVSAAAQDAGAQPAAAPSQVTSPRSDSKPAPIQLIKPGDRTCLQHTGSLIPPKKGACLPLPGRSYSGEELRNTGAIDNAHSLQMLDPSITRGY